MAELLNDSMEAERRQALMESEVFHLLDCGLNHS